MLVMPPNYCDTPKKYCGLLKSAPPTTTSHLVLLKWNKNILFAEGILKFLKHITTLARVAQSDRASSHNQKAVGSVPGQGTYLGCRFHPRQLPLPSSLPLPLKAMGKKCPQERVKKKPNMSLIKGSISSAIPLFVIHILSHLQNNFWSLILQSRQKGVSQDLSQCDHEESQ